MTTSAPQDAHKGAAGQSWEKGQHVEDGAELHLITLATQKYVPLTNRNLRERAANVDDAVDPAAEEVDRAEEVNRRAVVELIDDRGWRNKSEKNICSINIPPTLHIQHVPRAIWTG